MKDVYVTKPDNDSYYILRNKDSFDCLDSNGHLWWASTYKENDEVIWHEYQHKWTQLWKLEKYKDSNDIFYIKSSNNALYLSYSVKKYILLSKIKSQNQIILKYT